MVSRAWVSDMNVIRQNTIRLFLLKLNATKTRTLQSCSCTGKLGFIDRAFSASTRCESPGERSRHMKIHKTKTRICLHLAVLMVAGALTAAAQGSSVPAGRIKNILEWHESFEGSTGASGQEMVLNTSATYHFGRFSVGTGIPVYLNRSISPNQVSISEGIGDVF